MDFDLILNNLTDEQKANTAERIQLDLANIYLCSDCGQSISDSSKFCSKCGTFNPRNQNELDHDAVACEEFHQELIDEFLIDDPNHSTGGIELNLSSFCKFCGKKIEYPQ